MTVLLGFLGLIVWLPVSSPAHPISMSSAVADVYTNRVIVEMQILVEDLVLYNELKPNEDHVIPAEVLNSTAREHVKFLQEYFLIRDFNGLRLEGETESIDTTTIPEEGVGMADLMAFSVKYKFLYPLEEPPKYLSFSQEFGGGNAVLPAIMDLAVFQQGIWTEEVAQIGPGQPYVAEFDWSKPPKPMPKSWRERKRLREEKQREKLGITSYSSVYSYIYITDREVRHEILVPLLTLETWFPIPREDPDFLSVEEQKAARRLIQDYFSSHHPVEIDGIPVQPILERADFYGLDFRDFARFSPARRVSIYHARAGIILAYKTKSPPRKVRLTWEEFNQHTPFLKSVVYIHRDKAFQHFLVPSEPTFEWTSESQSHLPSLDEIPLPPEIPTLHIPVAGLAGLLLAVVFTMAALFRSGGRRAMPATLAVVVALVTLWVWPHGQVEIRDPRIPVQPVPEAEAEAIFTSLHHNIYRAFDYVEESAIYDALAQSVSGKLLEDLYLQFQKSLRMQEQGGAIARIESVDIIDDQKLPPKPDNDCQPDRCFEMQSTWTVTGTVEHWGHIHTRKNQYAAVFAIAALPTGWRITDFALREEKRLKFETGLRQFD